MGNSAKTSLDGCAQLLLRKVIVMRCRQFEEGGRHWGPSNMSGLQELSRQARNARDELGKLRWAMPQQAFRVFEDLVRTAEEASSRSAIELQLLRSQLSDLADRVATLEKRNIFPAAAIPIQQIRTLPAR
jgi:hypothetical protein